MGLDADSPEALRNRRSPSLPSRCDADHRSALRWQCRVWPFLRANSAPAGGSTERTADGRPYGGRADHKMWSVMQSYQWT